MLGRHTLLAHFLQHHSGKSSSTAWCTVSLQVRRWLSCQKTRSALFPVDNTKLMTACTVASTNASNTTLHLTGGPPHWYEERAVPPPSCPINSAACSTFPTYFGDELANSVDALPIPAVPSLPQRRTLYCYSIRTILNPALLTAKNWPVPSLCEFPEFVTAYAVL